MNRQDRLNEKLLEELNNLGAGKDSYDFSTIANLIKDGADPNVTNSDGWNALHRVAFFEFDCPNELLVTIVNKIQNINAVNNDQRTALMEAASENYLDMVSMLKKKRPDIDPNVQDRHKQTALHWAARITSDKMIELLLSFEGIDIDLQDDDHCTPLDLARRYKCARCIELLVKHPSQISKQAFKF
jgi:ankyrin repeat protein